MHVINEKKQMVKLNMLYQKKAWNHHLAPGDSFSIPTQDHYRIALPFIRFFGLTVINDDDDFPLVIPERKTEEIRQLTSTISLHDVHDRHDLVAALTEMPEMKSASSSLIIHDETGLQNKTKAQLRDMCVDYGIDTKGNKEDMIARLLERQKEDQL